MKSLRVLILSSVISLIILPENLSCQSQILQQLKKVTSYIPISVIGEKADQAIADQLLNLGVQDFLVISEITSSLLLEKYSHNWTEDKKQIHTQRIKMAINRIVANAIKFSSKGAMIKVTLTPDSQQIILRVEDQGLDIPIEEQSKILDRFY